MARSQWFSILQGAQALAQGVGEGRRRSLAEQLQQYERQLQEEDRQERRQDRSLERTRLARADQEHAEDRAYELKNRFLEPSRADAALAFQLAPTREDPGPLLAYGRARYQGVPEGELNAPQGVNFPGARVEIGSAVPGGVPGVPSSLGVPSLRRPPQVNFDQALRGAGRPEVVARSEREAAAKQAAEMRKFQFAAVLKAIEAGYGRASDAEKSRAAYAGKLFDQGYSESAAWAAAMKRFPGQTMFNSPADFGMAFEHLPPQALDALGLQAPGGSVSPSPAPAAAPGGPMAPPSAPGPQGRFPQDLQGELARANPPGGIPVRPAAMADPRTKAQADIEAADARTDLTRAQTGYTQAGTQQRAAETQQLQDLLPLKTAEIKARINHLNAQGAHISAGDQLAVYRAKLEEAKLTLDQRKAATDEIVRLGNLALADAKQARQLTPAAEQKAKALLARIGSLSDSINKLQEHSLKLHGKGSEAERRRIQPSIDQFHGDLKELVRAFQANFANRVGSVLGEIEAPADVPEVDLPGLPTPAPFTPTPVPGGASGGRPTGGGLLNQQHTVNSGAGARTVTVGGLAAALRSSNPGLSEADAIQQARAFIQKHRVTR